MELRALQGNADRQATRRPSYRDTERGLSGQVERVSEGCPLWPVGHPAVRWYVVARGEGFEEIAEWFETLAKAEKSHAGRFTKGLQTLSLG